MKTPYNLPTTIFFNTYYPEHDARAISMVRQFLDNGLPVGHGPRNKYDANAKVLKALNSAENLDQLNSAYQYSMLFAEMYIPQTDKYVLNRLNRHAHAYVSPYGRRRVYEKTPMIKGILSVFKKKNDEFLNMVMGVLDLTI